MSALKLLTVGIIISLIVLGSCGDKHAPDPGEQIDSTLVYPNCIQQSQNDSLDFGGCWFTIYQYLDSERSMVLLISLDPGTILLDSLCRTYGLTEEGVTSSVEIKPYPKYFFDFCGHVRNIDRPIVEEVVGGTITVSTSRNFEGFDDEFQFRMLRDNLDYFVSARVENIVFVHDGNDSTISEILINKNRQVLW